MVQLEFQRQYQRHLQHQVVQGLLVGVEFQCHQHQQHQLATESLVDYRIGIIGLIWPVMMMMTSNYLQEHQELGQVQKWEVQYHLPLIQSMRWILQN